MKQASKNKAKLINKSAKIVNFFNGFPIKKIYGGFGHILMFHRVLPFSNKNRIWSNSYLEVTPEFLENTILYFKNKNYQFISLDELDYFIENKIFPKKKFVIYTFDDGFKDNLIYAYPIFKKYNIPLTIYVTTSFPDYKACL
ncbi:MAG: polysaccharide deacetylase family protein, partial [Bacteroidales bacterium]|nr:polysaccharide deacetylase family protein [Bacteroidales bacterium]